MPDTTSLRAAIIAQARVRLGIPYGLPPGPGETDCSLYVRDVYEAAGLPFSSGVRTAEQERQDTVPIPWDQVLPGDLLFFEHTYDAGPPSADGHIASHIGISLGAGTHRMLNAVEPVSKESDISTAYWQDKIFEARRHPALVGAAMPAPPPPPVGQMPRGIDVSSNNPHPIDWDSVAASGIAFAAIKTSEDDGYLNPYFKQDWAGAKQVGLKRLAYHFARPEGNDAVEEANYFVDMILANGTIEPGDLLVPDMESGSGDIGRWTVDFARQVHRRVPALTVTYSGTWFMSGHSFDEPELAESPLWLAAYQDAMPAAPAPWTKVTFWQFSDKGQVPGILGDVDLNVFNGTLEELRALGMPGGGVTVPGSSLDAWRDRVGSGILTMMAEDETVPLMPSTWLPLGRGQADAEAEWSVGEDGTQYIWHLPSGRHFRYPAA